MRKEYSFLSDRFDVDDIRRLREYNSLRYMRMTPEEVQQDIDERTDRVLHCLEYLRGMDKIFYGEDESDAADGSIRPEGLLTSCSKETVADKKVAEAI